MIALVPQRLERSSGMDAQTDQRTAKNTSVDSFAVNLSPCESRYRSSVMTEQHLRSFSCWSRKHLRANNMRDTQQGVTSVAVRASRGRAIRLPGLLQQRAFVDPLEG